MIMPSFRAAIFRAGFKLPQGDEPDLGGPSMGLLNGHSSYRLEDSHHSKRRAAHALPPFQELCSAEEKVLPSGTARSRRRELGHVEPGRFRRPSQAGRAMVAIDAGWSWHPRHCEGDLAWERRKFVLEEGRGKTRRSTHACA